MAGCTVNSEASPEFTKLRAQWKKKYRHIGDDLDAAFKAISQDILACKAFRLQAGPVVEVYKYRQNSSDIRRGSKYGWRIFTFFHKTTRVMYPFMVYPKTEWADAGDAHVNEAIKEIRQILGYCISPGCDGEMAPSSPAEKKQSGAEIQEKIKCQKCGAIQWSDVQVA